MVGRYVLSGVSPPDGTAFGLLRLLLSFTSSGTASRSDARRDLIVAAANNIGTAYLRVGLLPESHQPALRASFRRYLTPGY